MVGRRGSGDVITVLVGGRAAVGDTVALDTDEAHHLRVRRATDTRVQVRNGAGLSGYGVLTERGGRFAVTIERAELVPAPAPLVLAVGAGDRERFGLLVEKAAELGVSRVVPLETERSRSVAGRLRDDHVIRLRRRALEAVKQSGAAWAPDVSSIVRLDAFLSDDAAAGESGTEIPRLRWLADGEGTLPPAGIATSQPVTVIVGPEGGLTAEERAAALDAGYGAISLGPHVLRFETAAVAAAVAIHIARRRGAE